ncbi:Ankyrin repeat-containing protein BDA1 [Vitis vinifera]|uniref:Ankyrin repeat-containing protein BDA1 n=1 Tax=Vitis vinifera TaxID=29760 RepID=A0A438EXK8_VITVI|nr:Ankyrin repeat-containing protein BDA1 [Vitis vinifera]
MEQMLYEAAAQGSVTSLYELLLKDPLIIDRVMLNYTETPLHIAALLGHADFAKEILLQKPELAAELDYRRSSPLHLAAAKGYIEIVKELLFVNPEMCLACDRDGRNPVHLAAMRGHVHVLKELIQAKPHATWATLPRDAHEIMSAKDDNGFTILHLAVADKQLETINYLLSSTSIEVNAVNLNGCTALDILAQSRRDVQDMEISELLRHVGAAKAKNISFSAYEFGSSRTRGMSSDADDQNRVPCPIGKNCNEFNKKKDDWLDKQQSALMVVASLIATMAFLAGVSPPGDVWGDNSKYDPEGSPAPAPSSETPHTAGLSIMADNNPDAHTSFLVTNTISFLASLSIILLLISGLPINRRLFVWILMVIMWIAVTAMTLTYLVSITALTPNHELDHLSCMITVVAYAWTCLVALLLVDLILKMIKKLIKWRGRSSSMIINGTTTI